MNFGTLKGLTSHLFYVIPDALILLLNNQWVFIITYIMLVRSRSVDELDFNRYGLSEDQHVTYNGLVVADCQHGTIGQMKDLLTKIYCGKIGVEFNYIESEAEREWLSSNYESLYQETLTNTERVEIAELLIKSQAWDHFLAKKFPTVKRYGGEGAENLMTFFKQILELSVRGIVISISI